MEKACIKKWLNEICPINRSDDFIQVVAEEGESKGDGIADFRTKFTCKTYTHDCCYSIVAIDRDDGGYLGCVASMRKPYAGEDHTRSNDLINGPLTRQTWEAIKDAILAHELVKIVR